MIGVGSIRGVPTTMLDDLAIEIGFRVIETNHGVQVQFVDEDGIVRACQPGRSQHVTMWNKIVEQALEIEQLKSK